MVHGLRPGPTLFTVQAHFAFSTSWSMMLVKLLFLSVCLYGAMVLDRVALFPVHLHRVCLFFFSIMGAFAPDRSMLDVWIALISGVVGFFRSAVRFLGVPLAIGHILGGILEQRRGQSMVMLDEEWWLMATRLMLFLFLALTALALFHRPLWGLPVHWSVPFEFTGR